jgi:pilus assembly protein Flp/PilA
MINRFRDFVRDETGAAAAEYVLILAIVGAGVAGGAFYLGDKIKSGLKAKGDQITTCSSANSQAAADAC